MGLIQNVIEGAGITTVSVTLQPHISKGVGVPRALYVRFPWGNVFGEAHTPSMQHEVLTTALSATEAIATPGTILEHPTRWRGRKNVRNAADAEECMQCSVVDSRYAPLREAVSHYEDLVDALERYRDLLEDRHQRYAAEGRDPATYERPVTGAIAAVSELLEVLEGDTHDRLRWSVDKIGVLESVDQGAWV